MRWDSVPDRFSFVDQIQVLPQRLVVSPPISIQGINVKTSARVRGGEFSVNAGPFRTQSMKVKLGDTIRVRGVASKKYGTTTKVLLTVGGIQDTFSITTIVESYLDKIPDTFRFSEQIHVTLDTPILSESTIISGINVPIPIQVIGGLYSINGKAFTDKADSVQQGDRVQIQLISANDYNTTKQALVTVGQITTVFSVVTQASPFILPPASPGKPAFTSEHFLGPYYCVGCHNGIQDANGKDVSIETDWSSTMMANSARDPFWRAKVRSELTRNPHLSTVINDKCTRCHAPMAHFEAKSQGETLSIVDGGLLSSEHPRHDAALGGVSCTVCHQIENSPDLGTISRFSGQYTINVDKRLYGQYTDPFIEPMVTEIGYLPMYSEHLAASKLCATCHNLKTPYVDEFGAILSNSPESEFPEQMPYSEWEHSEYAVAPGKNCQDCHMPRRDDVKLSMMSLRLPGRDQFGVHEFVGGNRLVLDLFYRNQKQLGVVSQNFQETLAKTQAMLFSAATIQAVSSGFDENGMWFVLRIESGTGHKLPTSYPSRRVVLHVKVKDAQNNIVFESGKINPDGSVVGVNSDTYTSTFEPHYDWIDRPDQVQVYESVMGDNRGTVTYTLLRGASYLKDNRLLPKGFDKRTASNDVRVVGDALYDENFIGGSDHVGYRISAATQGEYFVEAELVHQPLGYAFACDLFKEDGPEIQDFKKMFDSSNEKTSQIATSAFRIVR